MANNKYYYQAEIHFGDNSAVFMDKRKNFKDCVEDLDRIIERYECNGNNITKVGIFKRKVDE